MESTSGKTSDGAFALRSIVYTHIFGVICAGFASRIDWLPSPSPLVDLIGALTAIVAVGSFIACPVAAGYILLSRRRTLTHRDIAIAILLECVIINVQLLAMLPAVQ
jgi:hypothetical protein